MKKLISILLAVVLIAVSVPLVFAGAEDTAEVFVVADGVTYQVQQGEVFDYVYYLCTGEQLCSLQGIFHYDTDGLEMIAPEPENKDQEGYTTELIFTNLWEKITYNEVSPGRIKYNYSKPKGIECIDENFILIKTQFKVTASSGIYEINNDVLIVAGASEYVYLQDGEAEAVDPEHRGLKKNGSSLPDKTPYGQTGTEPGTDPASSAPTDPPTQPVTDPPTDPPTQPVTDPPTDPPTQPVTVPPTDPPTQPVTDPPTTPQTEPLTDKPTDGPTEQGTDAATDQPTAPSTEMVTEPLTEAPASAPTQSITEQPTDHDVPVRRYGDVDGDGDISIIDGTDIQRYLAGIIDFDADQLIYGDVDGDGDISITDCTYIQRWLAGIWDDNPLVILRGYPTP